MGNQAERGKSIYWKPAQIELGTYLKSGKFLVEVREAAGRPCSALEIADTAVQSVATKFQQIAEVHSTRNPEQTPLAHFKKVAALAESVGKKARQTLMDTQINLSRRKVQIESGIADRLGLRETSQAEEIRRVVREMPEEKRFSFIQEAIGSGDAQVMGAILNGHPALTGLSAKNVETYRQQYYHQHAAEDLRHIRAIDQAHERIDTQIDEVVFAEAAFTKIPEKLAEEARRADEAFAQAEKW